MSTMSGNVPGVTFIYWKCDESSAWLKFNETYMTCNCHSCKIGTKLTHVEVKIGF